MPSVLIRDVSPDVLVRLKARAKSGGRSLQAELHALLARADQLTLAETRTISERWILRLASRRQRTDSVALIRDDRNRR